jgi:hypothetical protein
MGRYTQTAHLLKGGHFLRAYYGCELGRAQIP